MIGEVFISQGQNGNDMLIVKFPTNLQKCF